MTSSRTIAGPERTEGHVSESGVRSLTADQYRAAERIKASGADLAALFPGRLVDVASGCRSLRVSLEFLNPCQSIKFKPAWAMMLLHRANRAGEPSRLIESSSGNLGLALASLTAGSRDHFTCVVDPNSNPLAITEMRAMGAEVVMVEPDDDSSYLRARLAYVAARADADAGLHHLDQYANPANPAIHWLTTAPSLFAAGVPDVIFVGVGTAGTLRGISAYVADHDLPTRVIGVDVEGSVTFGGPAGRRLLPGLGAGVVPPLYSPELVAAEVTVSEGASVRECRRLARETGVCAGASTGSVLAAVAQSLESGLIGAEDAVVVLAPDSGNRYLHSVYDDTWMRANLG
jgi:cysteine synthase A